MKKNLFYLFAIVCSMSLFSACSSDDDDLASEIKGDYAGNMVVTTKDATLPPVSQTVYITKSSDTNVSIEVKNFSVATMNMGNITAVCSVNKSGSNYTLSGETKVKVPTMGNIEVPVTVSGTVTDSQLALNIAVPLANVTAAFNGTK